MICEQIHPKLLLLTDEELSKQEITTVEAHLAQCPQCKRLHARILLEKQILSTALAAPDLSKDRIRYLEESLLQQLVPPLHVTLIESTVSFISRFLIVFLVLASYFFARLMPTETMMMYEEVTQAFIKTQPLSNLALNVAIAIFIAFIVVFQSRVGWLVNRIKN